MQLQDCQGKRLYLTAEERGTFLAATATEAAERRIEACLVAKALAERELALVHEMLAETRNERDELREMLRAALNRPSALERLLQALRSTMGRGSGETARRRRGAGRDRAQGPPAAVKGMILPPR